MFIFDVETLGVESNAVILSAALIHFDPETSWSNCGCWNIRVVGKSA